MVAAVAIGGSVIGAGASIAGSSSASKTAKNAAAANNALQASIYDENKQTLSPYVGAGDAAAEQLRRLYGLGDSNTGIAINGKSYTAAEQQAGAISAFQDSAPYQAEFQAGQKAVTGALGAKGLLDSGAALKGLQSYGDQFLSSKLNTYESQLAALTGTGLGAASAQAGVGQSYANATSANNNVAANASENAALSNASTINGALGSLTSGYGLYSGIQALGSSYGKGALSGYSPIDASTSTSPISIWGV